MIGRAVNDGDVAVAAAEEGEGDHSITQKRYQVAEMARPNGRDLISESGKGGEEEDKSQFIMNASGRR